MAEYTAPASGAMPLIPVVERAAGVRERVAEWREADQTIALVPTLGNLHAGHL
ncbi:MAG TPA: pantoate--beta-alanine ligase, partial [Gammaproteobacteria bacterium]|nr:pantoate--beta-alanine ligase [Gammaproteobacteria bacterium]